MRILAIVLCALLVLIQYPLWLGKGGWMRVWDLDRQVAAQKESNHKLEVRNQALDADVRDLKQGTEAIEERARYELGMIRQDEVFFQLLKDPPFSPLAPLPVAQPASAPAAAPQPKPQAKH
jgi:cell division protein FtsB